MNTTKYEVDKETVEILVHIDQAATERALDSLGSMPDQPRSEEDKP